MCCRLAVIGSPLMKERIMLLNNRPLVTHAGLMGQAVVGICVVMVGYASWAAQPAGEAARVVYEDSAIRISADRVRSSERGVRYTGNVVIEALQKTSFGARADRMTAG